MSNDEIQLTVTVVFESREHLIVSSCITSKAVCLDVPGEFRSFLPQRVLTIPQTHLCRTA